MTLPLGDTEASVSVSDEEIESYYQENQSDYLALEQVAIEYVDVSAAELVEGLEFSEEQLRQQYQQEMAAFEPSVERHAAHILIEKREDGTEVGAADEVVARLAAGEDFAELAVELSDDPSSKDQGGDLGYTAGDIFPEAFEEALAALAVGETSGVVETEAGLHIIKLLDEQGGEIPSFEEQRAKIEQSLKAQEGDSQFVELLERLGDLAYNADNLEEVADELGLTASRSELFGRAGGAGLVAEPAIIAAAFSDEVLLERNTSEVIELADNRVAVIRVIEHKPEHTKALDLVREDVVVALSRNKAMEKLAEQAESLKSQIEAGSDVESLAKSNDLEWQVSLGAERAEAGVDTEILRHVFSLPKPSTGPQVGGFHLTNGDYVLVSLTKVEAGELVELASEQQAAFSSTMARQSGMMDYAAYEALLKEQAEIEVR